MKRSQTGWIILLVVGGLWLAYRATSVGMGRVYVQELDGATIGMPPYEFVTGRAELSWPRTVGLWMAAFFTLAIFSFLYRDNPFYKLAESVVVGVSAGYWMVTALWDVLVPNLLGKLQPSLVQAWAMPGLSPVRDETWYMYFVPLVLGIMLLWRMAPRGGWIARWPLAFIVGITIGIRLIGFVQADLIGQVNSSIVPLAVYDETVQPRQFQFWSSFANLLTVLSLLACLVYFFFSVEHKGTLGKVSRVGIWVLMITFGTAFGYTVMGRFALLAIRFEFLFDDWLWLIDPTGNRLGM